MTAPAPPHVTSAPAGWHADPARIYPYRWWDGVAWTGWVSNGQVVLVETAAGPVSTDPRWTHTVPETIPTLPLRAGVIAATILGLLVATASWWSAPLWNLPGWLAVTVGYVVIFSVEVGLAWWAHRRWGTGTFRDQFGLRARWADLGWVPLCWFGTMVVLFAASLALLGFGIPTTSNAEDFREASNVDGLLIPILLAGLVGAPICEELFFRGLLLRSFRSSASGIGAVIGQGVLFGAYHFSPYYGLGNVGLIILLSLVGISFGAVATWSRRLSITMGAHFIVNFVSLALPLMVGTGLRMP